MIFAEQLMPTEVAVAGVAVTVVIGSGTKRKAAMPDSFYFLPYPHR
jgi:hypothetical protein